MLSAWALQHGHHILPGTQMKMRFPNSLAISLDVVKFY